MRLTLSRYCRRRYLSHVASPPAQGRAATTPRRFQLDKTTWTYTDSKGTKVKELIDAKGNFISKAPTANTSITARHVMKDDKACFTSAMTKDGEVCWTTKPVAIGKSMDTVSDKGEKLTVWRRLCPAEHAEIVS